MKSALVRESIQANVKNLGLVAALVAAYSPCPGDRCGRPHCCGSGSLGHGLGPLQHCKANDNFAQHELLQEALDR